MKRILFVIALVAIAVIEFLLWINALVDGKYLVEGSGVEWKMFTTCVSKAFLRNVRKLRNSTAACLLSDLQKEEMKDPDARKHRGPLTFFENREILTLKESRVHSLWL